MREAQENRPSRLRTLVVAAGIAIVTVGCLQIALHIFEDPRPDAPASLQHSSPPPALPQNNSAATPPRAQSPAAAVPAPASPRSGLEPGPSQAAPTETAPPVMLVPGGARSSAYSSAGSAAADPGANRTGTALITEQHRADWFAAARGDGLDSAAAADCGYFDESSDTERFRH
jgi:hypothetical protein